MRTIESEVRALIAVRVVAVTTLLLAVMIVEYTVTILLPINYLYMVAALTYVLTLLYIGVGKVVRSRTINISIQIAGDLIIESILVYFTGGLESPFSFLYLVSIITGSMMLYRKGGLLTASGCVILYAGIGDLLYYHLLPPPPATEFPLTAYTSYHLYVNLATNVGGYYATAFLTSFISEKLRATFRELDANRQNLARLEAINQNVVESIPSGLLTVASDHRVSFANPAAALILQRPASELVGRTLVEIGFFAAEEWEAFRRDVATKQITRGEKNYPNGSESRIIGYALTPLATLDGAPGGVTLIFQDLSQVKRLEAELRLKDRMAAVGELSAGIAHEIRNPLAAIAGSAQVLGRSGNLTAQEKRLMSIILKESERLNKSIADFLQFVKPQERRAVEFDVAANLAETLDLLSNSVELAHGHRIERAIVPSAFHINGDPDQIRQVFWNIAKNAIQAMPHGGCLRVSTWSDSEFFHIDFADTGKGISDIDQQQLFQPFRTNFPSGTGLGMAISYRIVQEHGGKIGIESTPGRGTTITVSLPLVSSAAAQVRNGSAVAAAAGESSRK
jgi:two-component system, NtrC family, sensor histidine kinase PilS